jgi:DNA gyrase subunit A
MKITERTGPLVSAGKVYDEDDLLLITKTGMIIRMEVKNISRLGRATQGVKLINLREGDEVVGIEVISGESDDDQNLFDEDD